MNRESRIPIIILHGWRVKSSRYGQIKKIFEDNGYEVFAPNLPGTGDEKLIKEEMAIDDYINFVLSFYKDKKIEKAILVCHSFGGRVGAKLAAKYPEKVGKLILTGTPLIKQKLTLRKKVILQISKLIKEKLKISFQEEKLRKALYFLLREWDYYNAPKELKKTFRSIIAEDISSNLPKIKSPTLIIWGQNDTFVPKTVGQKIATEIPNAIYKEIPNATHRLPYENSEAFAKLVLDFIK
jgi:pimeloyl-ACP methyl ester carboxylesterase